MVNPLIADTQKQTNPLIQDMGEPSPLTRAQEIEALPETRRPVGLERMALQKGPPPEEPPFKEYVKSKFRRGRLPVITGKWYSEAMWGRLSEEVAFKKAKEEFDKQQKTIIDKEDLPWWTPKGAIGAAAELLPFMIGGTKEAAKYGLPMGMGFAGVAALAGQAGPQVLLPEEVITVPVAFGMGANVGARYGVIKHSMDIEGGNLYYELRKNKIPPETARPLALAGGLGIGLIEVSQLRLLGRPFKGIFAKTVRNPAFKKPLLKMVTRYLQGVGVQVGEEEAQEIVQLATETLGGLLEKQKIPTKEEWTNRIIQVARKATPGMAVLMLPGAAIDVTTMRKAEPKPPKKITEDLKSDIKEYEDAKDLWFGEKDEKVMQSKIEQRLLQKELRQRSGEKTYGKASQDYDKAIQIYIDTKRNPEHLTEYYNKLTPRQKRVVDLSQNLPDNIRVIADKIDQSYQQIGLEALDAEVIRNVLDNYAGRIWDLKTERKEGVRKFGVKTRHALQRKLGTIIEGWAKGFDLKVEGATSNLQILKEEISKTIEDKKFLKKLQKLKTIEGEPLISPRHLEGYVRVEHPNFKSWRYAGISKVDIIKKSMHQIYETNKTEKEDVSVDTKSIQRIGEVVSEALVNRGFSAGESQNIIQRLRKAKSAKDAGAIIKTVERKVVEKERIMGVDFNVVKGRNFIQLKDGTILERKELYAPEVVAKNMNSILGTSKLWNVPGIHTLTKYNAWIKAWILQTSLFHHQAFIRSYWFGTQDKAWHELSPRQAYKQGIKAIEEQNPIIMMGVRNGFTFGVRQDWSEDIMKEKTAIGTVLDKMKATREIKDKILRLRQQQSDFLFGEFGAGLKAKAFLVEFRNQTKKHPNENPDVIAKRVANLINDDFGGLHLQRLGRNPTLQHIFRLFALAPDWTESNVRTMVKAFKAGDKAEVAFYRRFWAGVLTKSMLLTVMANALLSLGGDEDDRFVRKYRRMWKEGNLKWLDVDVTRLYRALGGSTKDRKYFSIIGHFRDPIKFISHPIRSAHHKGSVIYRFFHEALTGVDWAGRRYTTAKELFKEKRLVKWEFGKGGAIEYNQIPAFMLAQLRGFQPIQIQNLLRWITGEMAGFDAFFNAIGARLTTTYGKGKPKTGKPSVGGRNPLIADMQ